MQQAAAVDVIESGQRQTATSAGEREASMRGAPLPVSCRR